MKFKINVLFLPLSPWVNTQRTILRTIFSSLRLLLHDAFSFEKNVLRSLSKSKTWGVYLRQNEYQRLNIKDTYCKLEQQLLILPLLSMYNYIYLQQDRNSQDNVTCGMWICRLVRHLSNSSSRQQVNSRFLPSSELLKILVSTYEVHIGVGG